jgi:hypothetical protein
VEGVRAVLLEVVVAADVRVVEGRGGFADPAAVRGEGVVARVVLEGQSQAGPALGQLARRQAGVAEGQVEAGIQVEVDPAQADEVAATTQPHHGLLERAATFERMADAGYRHRQLATDAIEFEVDLELADAAAIAVAVVEEVSTARRPPHPWCRSRWRTRPGHRCRAA